jgi:phospholipase A1
MMKKIFSFVCFFVMIFIASLSYAEIDAKNISSNSDSDQKTILAKKLEAEKRIYSNPVSIMLYNPTYVLPYYYTKSPYFSIYKGNTPDNQELKNAEFKGQISFLIPVIPNLFKDSESSLDFAYTQLSYWQVYADSQYFRETNYEPEIFVQKYFRQHWLFRGGFDHQSNGRGGVLERSWNRAVFTAEYSGNNWLVGLKTWAMIFRNQSSELHNPDIEHYLGYDSVIFAHKILKATASLELQNLESGLQRGSVTASLSYPLSKHMSFYVQYFNGYGQSLIEYNHRTQAMGVGISFNNWI